MPDEQGALFIGHFVLQGSRLGGVFLCPNISVWIRPFPLRKCRAILQIAARFTKSGYKSTPFLFMLVGAGGDVSSVML
jgi:hypothetical protein